MLLIWRCCRLLLCFCDGFARYCLKGFLVNDRWDLNPRALPWGGRKLHPIAKGRADCLTHPVNGDIADEDTTLVLKGTHAVLLSCLCCHMLHEIPPHSARSLIPISRAELAMTGMEESSCSSAPVTGKRMPGIASPTAIARTPSEKIRFCLIARMAW